MEDALGDMDFKVAGTMKGVTAIQMDIKIKGLSREILDKALKQAHEGRIFIMGKMLECISEPRKELSPYAPRIITMHIDPDKIRDVIGPGGKVIKQITEETGAKIDIDDSGLVYIASVDAAGGEKGEGMDRKPDKRRGSRGNLPRQSHAYHELWRLCGNPAGQRRPGPHFPSWLKNG